MADSIKIDGNKVLQSSKNIDIINKRIDNDFETLYSKVNNFIKRWDSCNAAKATRSINKIKDVHFSNRFDVINHFARFLVEQTVSSYDAAENHTESATKYFK